MTDASLQRVTTISPPTVHAPRAVGVPWPASTTGGPPRRRDGGHDRDGHPTAPVFPPAVIATLLVIAADVMLFAGLLFAFWVLRLAEPVWPPPLQPRLPLGVTAVNTLVLLASSAGIARAVRALYARDRSGLVRGLASGALLGGLFLLVQGFEWTRLIGFGLTAGSSIYGGLFYTVIGAHALHVVAALAWVGVTLRGARRGRPFLGDRSAPVRACALYWHFVVALWPVLYVCVYLL